jgi:hypothetical protein
MVETTRLSPSGFRILSVWRPSSNVEVPGVSTFT